MVPEELISLEELGGPSFAMADHADHIHIGWQPALARAAPEARFVQLLKPDQWQRLTDRLERDRQPGGADRALEVLAAGQAGQGRRPPAAPAAATEPPTAPSRRSGRIGASGRSIFGFVQFEFAGTLAVAGRPLPGAGRQRRGGAAGAGARNARRARPRAAPAPAAASRPSRSADPTPLPLTRATAVRAFEPFDRPRRRPSRWLEADGRRRGLGRRGWSRRGSGCSTAPSTPRRWPAPTRTAPS